MPISAARHVVVAAADVNLLESKILGNPYGSAAAESEVWADARPNIARIFVVRNHRSVALQYRPQFFVLVNDVIQIKQESVLVHSNQHALSQ